MRFVTVSLMLFATGPVLAQPAADPPALLPGWKWQVEPFALGPSWPERNRTHLLRDGSLVIQASRSGRVSVVHTRAAAGPQRGAAATEFRVHLFDRAGSSLPLGGTGGSSNGKVAIVTTRAGASVKPELVARVGLARLDLDGKRIRSREAMVKATSLGAKVLPLPVKGEPFSFSLETLDGKTLTAEAFEGKVVLIDCWATC